MKAETRGAAARRSNLVPLSGDSGARPVGASVGRVTVVLSLGRTAETPGGFHPRGGGARPPAQ